MISLLLFIGGVVLVGYTLGPFTLLIGLVLISSLGVAVAKTIDWD